MTSHPAPSLRARLDLAWGLDQRVLRRFDRRITAFTTRLANQRAWPSLDTAVLIAVGLGVFFSLLELWYFLTLYVPSVPRLPLDGSLLGSGALLELLALVVVPIFGTLVASAVTSADSKTVQSELLVLTDIPGHIVYQGYWLASVYRVRLALALAAGGLPLLMAAPVSIALNSGWAELATLMWMVQVLLAGLGVWSLSLCAIAYGIDAAMSTRSPVGAALLALIMTGAAAGCSGSVMGMFSLCCGPPGILVALLMMYFSYSTVKKQMRMPRRLRPL